MTLCFCKICLNGEASPDSGFPTFKTLYEFGVIYFYSETHFNLCQQNLH